MMQPLFSKRIHHVLLLLLACLVSISCHPDADRFLSLFPKTVPILEPIDSIDLESVGIIASGADIDIYGNCLIVQKHNQHNENYIDLLNLDTDQVIHCFKHGRGPGEILSAMNHRVQGDTLWLIDLQKNIAYGMNLKASLESGEQQIAASVDISKPSIIRLGHTVRAANSWVATGIFKPGCWYTILDSTSDKGIPFFIPEEWKGFSDAELSIIHTNSKISASPKGDRVVVVIPPGVISLSRIDDSRGIIEEYCRKEYAIPILEPIRQNGATQVRNNGNQKRGLIKIFSTDDNIFCLYSDRTYNSELPSYECEYLAQFDWDANPIRLYKLSHPVNGLYIENDIVYGITGYPATCVYLYALQTQ